MELRKYNTMKKLSILLILIFAMAIGMVCASFIAPVQTWLVWQWQSSEAVYVSENQSLVKRAREMKSHLLKWGELLPPTEMTLLRKYQIDRMAMLDNQFEIALKAANDDEYKSSLVSTHTVDTFFGEVVAISGFIVPLEVNEKQQVTQFFFVPYFGACIHYPPPPPNQIIYSRLEGGLDDININQAYTLTGVLRGGLFEDPAGTSAYILEIAEIHEYFGEPDDVRQHAGG